MNCPNPQCGKKNVAVTVHRQPAVSMNFHGTVKCIAYCCEACGFILGVESDPLERDAQMTKLQHEVAAHAKLVDQLMRKYAGLKQA